MDAKTGQDVYSAPDQKGCGIRLESKDRWLRGFSHMRPKDELKMHKAESQ